MLNEVVLPHRWQPRPYQMPLWRALEAGCKRAIAVWFRRAGKDDLCLHWAACSAMQRAGNYWHMLPQFNQGRRAIWEAVNPRSGRKRIDEAFPHEIRASTNTTTMTITFKNGSTWSVVGSDNFNALVGAPPVGIVFSEWALADPNAWAYLRPILAENGGWALFITTPRGRNHAATMFERAKSDPDWFAERIRADETSVFTPETLARERRELVAEFGADVGESMFDQEYLVSFDAAVIGSYYGKAMLQAEKEGRIARVPWEPTVPVNTAWDLGLSDQTCIWFYQIVGRERRFIDFVHGTGADLGHYVKLLKERPYVYGRHALPHDVEAGELGTGRKRVDVLNSLGLLRRDIDVVPSYPGAVADGIQAVRSELPKCWFDEGKCAYGIDALRQYKREWDADRKVFREKPLHDWTSDPADAFRMFAMSVKDRKKGDGKINYPKLGVA